jgi:hypothetical protein
MGARAAMAVEYHGKVTPHPHRNPPPMSDRSSATLQSVDCPVCRAGHGAPYTTIDGYAYYACVACESLFVDPDVLAAMDEGRADVGEYADEYWEQERDAAIERSEGIGPCVAGEAILYCRRPVERFLDIGAGAGYLVRKLQQLLDVDGAIFHGVEKFPPDYAERLPNLHHGDIATLQGKYDAGVCIEVVEHLTPTMLDGLVAGLARVSQPGSFWIFNTGMPAYVRNEDPGYLDPKRRGHVVSYSVAGLTALFAAHGFRIGALPGKSFAFYAEFQVDDDIAFDTRFYHPVEANRRLLQRNGLLACAAFESARSYYFQQESQERTRWALSLDRLLGKFRGLA